MILLSILAGAWLAADLAMIMAVCRAASENTVQDGVNSLDQGTSDLQTCFEFEREEEDLDLAQPGSFCARVSSAHSAQ